MEESQKEPEKTDNQKEESERIENKKEESEKNENKKEESGDKTEEKEKPKEGGRKIPLMKKSIEEVLKKVVKAKRMFKFIKRKVPGKIDAEKRLLNMRQDSIRPKKEVEENDFENLNIINRSSSVAERIFKIECDLKKIEEEKKMIEEERKKREERRKNREAERKKREEERKKKEEEEKRKKEEEERIRKEEEERKKKEEEEKRRKEEEEEERRKKEEEERMKKEIEQIKDEEEKKKREEEERIKREEEEKRRKEEEERKRKEEEERKKKEEEERKKKEEEEKRKKEEEERKKKEEEENRKKEAKKGVEKIKHGFLSKLNKKEEELTDMEKASLEQIIAYEKSIEDYNNSTYREANENSEGRDIKYNFEEIKEISTEPLNLLEVTKSGKIIALSNKDISKITIYSEKTYEEEDCIVLESKVNSIAIVNNYIYCALEEPEDNILIISLDDKEDQVYLTGHSCPVTDLTLTKYGYLVSSDVEGNIFVWKNNEIKKTGNVFHSCINTITETKENTQGIAILSFKEELIKFYDLRYSTLECIETITNIKGSGLKNNMIRLNENILAVAGTYIYIIDLNSLIVTNMINCLYANDSISNFHFNEKGYIFVSQSLIHSWTDEYEKGVLGYYQYNFKDPVYPDVNTLVKLASKPNSHEHFICSIKQIDSNTIVTGGLDGKIKFWVLKDLIK